MMKDKQNQEGRKEEQAEEQQTEGVVGATHDADASNYVLQPTAHELPAFLGSPPMGRFAEEVHKESDERVGEAMGEAHPEENRAPLGIGPDDEVPDTTGRAAHKRRTK